MTKQKNPSLGTTDASEKVSILVAQQVWIDSIEKILEYMATPICTNSEQEMAKQTENLRTILSQAYVKTQEHLLVKNTTGSVAILKSDPVGWTTASTVYSSPAVLKKNKHCALVNKILQEFIDADEKKAVDVGLPTTAANILAAQMDSLDPNKSEISLKGAKQPNGEKTDVIIDKENGDTTFVETDQQGNTRSFSVKGFWKNVKDFCANIWKWLCNLYTNALNWVKSFFSVPKDADVILATIDGTK